jgi:hypothetical protein
MNNPVQPDCDSWDSTGWVCENHPDRPWRGGSDRADACDCGAGMPCRTCNPSGGIDDPPRTIAGMITEGKSETKH